MTAARFELNERTATCEAIGQEEEGSNLEPEVARSLSPSTNILALTSELRARAKFMKMKIWAKLPCLHFFYTVVRLMDSLNLSMKRHFYACYTCVRGKMRSLFAVCLKIILITVFLSR